MNKIFVAKKGYIFLLLKCIFNAKSKLNKQTKISLVNSKSGNNFIHTKNNKNIFFLLFFRKYGPFKSSNRNFIFFQKRAAKSKRLGKWDFGNGPHRNFRGRNSRSKKEQKSKEKSKRTAKKLLPKVVVDEYWRFGKKCTHPMRLTPVIFVKRGKNVLPLFFRISIKNNWTEF